VTEQEIQWIRERAGEKVIYYHSFSLHFPFLHRNKEVFVFGGHCGCCGRWNWQWCLKGFEWTYPCERCCGEVD
jgi:hypothetical protein